MLHQTLVQLIVVIGLSGVEPDQAEYTDPTIQALCRQLLRLEEETGWLERRRQWLVEDRDRQRGWTTLADGDAIQAIRAEWEVEVAARLQRIDNRLEELQERVKRLEQRLYGHARRVVLTVKM